MKEVVLKDMKEIAKFVLYFTNQLAYGESKPVKNWMN